ncbi:hypothetical protein G6034_12730 [Arthrobacter sp. AETb3-4]|uniref:Uncharacterized protein n=1 Tax=Arthrobacter wenxiniae TaxID=2713570 RepID=A0A7Y7IJ27_9MICC|nr:hypothetical protein [Arthrobacter wenxiniae]
MLGRLDGGEGLLVADLDLAAVDRVRASLPVLANRRTMVNGVARQPERIG